MDCIDLFKRAAVALQTDSRYLVLDQTRKANDKDEELQNLIGEFNLARMDLNNEIGKSERNDARIAELNEKVNSLYGQIMGNEGMVAYNEAKRDCENLVNYIDAIINTAMNGGDPMTVQEPSASCTGSCSTCGRHGGFTGADIALQQPVHRNGFLHVVTAFRYGSYLCACQSEGQRGVVFIYALAFHRCTGKLFFAVFHRFKAKL